MGISIFSLSLDNNISIQRCKEKFQYTYQNKSHYYIPDFVVDGVYYEIKGLATAKDECKWRDFPQDKKLSIVDTEKIRPYLDYMISTYGKDFIKLYDIAG